MWLVLILLHDDVLLRVGLDALLVDVLVIDRSEHQVDEALVLAVQVLVE